VATHETTIHPFPAQERVAQTLPFVDRVPSIVDRPQPKITSEQVSKYAELAALVSELEAQQKALRAELLKLRAFGAEQETDSPYLLAFIDQERRTVDWKNHALALAAKVHGLDKVATWQAEVEQATPVTPITQIRVKANPVFATGLRKPAVSVDPDGRAVRFGD
jgi:hypothetical protein